jgi:hypothetical protein
LPIEIENIDDSAKADNDEIRRAYVVTARRFFRKPALLVSL